MVDFLGVGEQAVQTTAFIKNLERKQGGEAVTSWTPTPGTGFGAGGALAPVQGSGAQPPVQRQQATDKATSGEVTGSKRELSNEFKAAWHAISEAIANQEGPALNAAIRRFCGNIVREMMPLDGGGEQVDKIDLYLMRTSQRLSQKLRNEGNAPKAIFVAKAFDLFRSIEARHVLINGGVDISHLELSENEKSKLFAMAITNTFHWVVAQSTNDIKTGSGYVESVRARHKEVKDVLNNLSRSAAKLLEAKVNKLLELNKKGSIKNLDVTIEMLMSELKNEAAKIDSKLAMGSVEGR